MHMYIHVGVHGSSGNSLLAGGTNLGVSGKSYQGGHRKEGKGRRGRERQARVEAP